MADFDGEVTLFVRGMSGSGGAAPGTDVHSQPTDVRIATANAYRLQRFRDAIDCGYVGAKIVHGEFVDWIHWPTLE